MGTKRVAVGYAEAPLKSMTSLLMQSVLAARQVTNLQTLQGPRHNQTISLLCAHTHKDYRKSLWLMHNMYETGEDREGGREKERLKTFQQGYIFWPARKILPPPSIRAF